jgi:hypothetical protein
MCSAPKRHHGRYLGKKCFLSKISQPGLEPGTHLGFQPYCSVAADAEPIFASIKNWALVQRKVRTGMQK